VNSAKGQQMCDGRIGSVNGLHTSVKPDWQLGRSDAAEPAVETPGSIATSKFLKPKGIGKSLWNLTLIYIKR
jgi:hypothetical protein